MSRKRMLHVSACALALLVGCGGGRDAARPSGRGELLEIPEVSLEQLGPDVVDALRDRMDTLSRLAADTTIEPEELGRAYGATGMMFHAHELFDQAEACYRNARTLMPDEFRWAYYLGELQAGKGQVDGAIESFGQALELRPEDVPTRIALAKLQIDLGRFDEGERLLQPVLERDPSVAIAQYYLGQAAMARGDHAEAVERFEKTLELQPEATRVHVPLSYAYRAAGDERQADRHLALRGDGALQFNDPWMREIQGLTRGRQTLLEAGTRAFSTGDYETAASNYRRVVETEPDNAPAWVNLGAALFKLRRAQEARTAFERALSLDEDLPLAHRNLGTLLAAAGELEPAIEHYRRALEANPSDVTTQFNLANALRRAKRYPEARDGFLKVIELDPANGTARYAAAICSVRQGEYRTALGELESAMAAFPNDPRLANAAARLLAAAPEADLRDGRRALEIAERVVRANRSLSFVETLAMAHAELGEFDQAVEVQQGAIDIAAGANRVDLLPVLQDNMAAYRRGRPCREPWPAD